MSGVRLLDGWSPPEGAGDPVAVLATSFTFEADFFAQDCLSRFLRLSTVVDDDHGSISSIAAILEEEDRLTEAQVSVLVDRSSPAEKRNLRWDVLPVRAPGGLLHAKVAVLIWERAARIVIGSANLTAAGYRRNVEAAMAFDLRPDCQIPASIVADVSRELRTIVDLAPGPMIGAKARANATLDLLDERARALDLTDRTPRDLLLAVAASRPGASPLDRLPEVWRGVRPLRATVLSPFWDGADPAPALQAIRGKLTGRPASERQTTVVAAFDPFTGVISAPPELRNQPDAVVAFDPPDTELRTLHAKVLRIESDEWVATMIGSSNATQAGYGLNPRAGHHEINVWIGCPAGSPTARQLKGLLGVGKPIDLDAQRWDPPPDDDEPTTPILHEAFVSCTVHAATPASVVVELDVARLPATWELLVPTGEVILASADWQSAGSPPSVEIALGNDPLPPFLSVRWADGEAIYQATLPANIEDRSSLPPPAELADLPVEILLAALASSRPLPTALEHELRRRTQEHGPGTSIELDPLKRFDSSALLLQRTRHLSLALWRLEQRMGRPASSIEVIRWRFHGAIGPLAIADGVVAAQRAERSIPGEAHFLLAELALTVANVDWNEVGPGLDQTEVQLEVAEAIATIDRLRQELPPPPDPSLGAYVDDAFRMVQR